MQPWQVILTAAAVVTLSLILRSSLRKRRDFQMRDATRKLELVLQSKESVKAICPQKGFRCILTNSRILFEKKGKFTAFPIKSIKKATGTNEKGNRTVVPSKMVHLTLVIDQEYILKNTGEAFETFASLLLQKTAAKPKKDTKV